MPITAPFTHAERQSLRRIARARASVASGKQVDLLTRMETNVEAAAEHILIREGNAAATLQKKLNKLEFEKRILQNRLDRRSRQLAKAHDFINDLKTEIAALRGSVPSPSQPIPEVDSRTQRMVEDFIGASVALVDKNMEKSGSILCFSASGSTRVSAVFVKQVAPVEPVPVEA